MTQDGARMGPRLDYTVVRDATPRLARPVAAPGAVPVTAAPAPRSVALVANPEVRITIAASPEPAAATVTAARAESSHLSQVPQV